jgi:hypothetical protein
MQFSSQPRFTVPSRVRVRGASLDRRSLSFLGDLPALTKSRYFCTFSDMETQTEFIASRATDLADSDRKQSVPGSGLEIF